MAAAHLGFSLASVASQRASFRATSSGFPTSATRRTLRFSRSPYKSSLLVGDCSAIARLSPLTTRTIIRRSPALCDAADRRPTNRARVSFAFIDARHLIIPAVTRIQVPGFHVEAVVVGDGFVENGQNFLAQQSDARF